MARRCTAEIFGENVEENLTWQELNYLEYSIDTGIESLRMKNIIYDYHICVHWIPLFVALWFPISFFITYALAVTANHVYPWWPSISATGTTPPESCWFGLFVNTSTFLLLFAGYIRHAQLREYSSYRPRITPGPWTNLVASIIGSLSMFGLFLVANWQITTEFRIHFFGAELCFVCATIYFVFQTVFTYWMAPELNSMLLFVSRVLLSLVMVALNISCIYTNIRAVQMIDSGNITYLLHWDPSWPGYDWHLAYTISEWSLMIIFSLAVLTFFFDFKKIQVEEPRLQVKAQWSTDSYTF